MLTIVRDTVQGALLASRHVIRYVQWETRERL